ncbi:methyltransferase domain-containing protein [Lentzea sp. NPDC051838]|uniref:class I SAM-dependent methyltransferase n=1 Tax=Lentzea sp. NPDC051838 TaxID=3154849 RepID=UPI0034415037
MTNEYGDRWADIYDEWFGELTDTEPACAALAELAQGGPALEIGAGTGRLAIPLARLGVPVTAVEASAKMAARLRAKLSGERVEVVERDAAGGLADLAPDGGFRLAYLSCNTLFQLTDQESQLACVVGAGAALGSGGVLVIEASVPNVELLHLGSKQRIDAMDHDRVVLTEARVTVATQRKDSTIVLLDNGAHRVLPVAERYCWPAELDLMARLAGLTLRNRWSGWERNPFDSRSTGHVSVYVAA